MHIVRRLLIVAPTALTLSACASTEPNGMYRVTVSAAIATPAARPATGLAADLIVGGEGGSVSISSAQIVLSRLKLHDGVCADDEDDGEDADSLDDADGAPMVVGDEPDEPDTNDVDDEHDGDQGEDEDDEGCPPL